MTHSAPWRRRVRSKNAGVDKITFDVIFRDRATYDHVRKSRVLTRERVMSLYHVPAPAFPISSNSTPRYAIKFTLYRTVPSGSPGDPDIFGCQQYAPLLDLPVPSP